MTDREKFPAVINQKIAVHSGQRGSLVMRGLVAVQVSKALALAQDNDALYREARNAYNRITDDGNKHGWGDIWSTGELAELNAAFQVFQRLGDRQYSKAYFPLSRFYTGYQYIPENKELAQHYERLSFDWCYASQLQNDPEIWNDLGALYLCGAGIEANFYLAHFWFTKAADAGDAKGMFNLCRMYESGDGVEPDYEKTLYWQTKAARNGHIEAQYGFGLQYGHEAQCLLGEEYEFGDGWRDYKAAAFWYREAAEQGNERAQNNLGLMYANGTGMTILGQFFGIEKNVELAIYWFRKAAELGNQHAIKNLEELGIDWEIRK